MPDEKNRSAPALSAPLTSDEIDDLVARRASAENIHAVTDRVLATLVAQRDAIARTCGTCKHWDADDRAPVRACCRIEEKDSPAPMVPPYLILVGRGCREAAGLLMTPAGFGCNLHERNERCPTCNGRETILEPFGPCPTCQKEETK